MGGLFCSYFVDNRISRLRAAILKSELSEISAELSPGLGVVGVNSILNAEIDTYGNTPLMYALEARRIDVFRLLLVEFKADPNRANSHTDLRPLHVCAAIQLVDTNNNGYDPRPKRSLKYGTSNTAFISELKPSMLSSTASSEIEQLDTDRRGGVGLGSAKRFFTLTKSRDTLNDEEFGPSAKRSIDESTLREMIRLLVEHGADLNAEARLAGTKRATPQNMNYVANMATQFDLKTTTPLIHAVLAENLVAMDELLRAGCNADYQEPRTRLNALHLSCRMCRVDMVGVLAQQRGSGSSLKLDAKSAEGNTCLHWLAHADRDDMSVLQMVMTLLKRAFVAEQHVELDADRLHAHLARFIDEQNDAGQTALMLAASLNKQNLVKSLLDYEASVEIVDKNGMDAANFAKQNSCATMLSSYKRVRELTVKKSTLFLIPNRPDSEATTERASEMSSGAVAQFNLSVPPNKPLPVPPKHPQTPSTANKNSELKTQF